VSGERRAALVTGAASGLGGAVAAPVQRDWDVPAVDVRGDVDFQADLTTRVGNSDAVAAALERFGRLDAVIRTPAFNTWHQSRSPPRTARTR
jgi:NAD(P)-dependent dehydrogenase (short-subunit alcohol dehydrogenase family)